MAFVRDAAAVARPGLHAAALGLVLAVGLCGSAMAQTPPPQQQTQAPPTSGKPPKKDPGERIICVDEETLGTRLGTHRVCHTKNEWDQISRDAGDLVNSAQSRAPGSPGK
jgi:hypothetical protein